MPALPNQPNVFRVDTFFSLSDDHNVRTTLHFLWSGSAPSVSTCDALAASTRTLAHSQLLSLMDSDHALLDVVYTDLTSETAARGEATGTDAGTRGGGFLAAGTCALTSYQIARRYRGGKPRSYWPFGVASDLQDNNTWDSTFVTDVATQVGAYISGIEALTSGGTAVGAQVNISQYKGFASVQNPVTMRWRNIPLPRSVAITPDTILSMTVDTKPASQRRRALQSV